MPKPPARDRQELPLTRVAEQHLGDHQADELVVGDLHRPPTPRPGAWGRKERTRSAIKCDHKGVKVGEHGDLQVDVATGTSTFDTLPRGPFPNITATAVIYRSNI